MNYRMASIVSEETIIPAKTKVIELDMKDIVSRLQINVELEMDGTVLGDNLAAVVSNIELVDGSEVLFSMSGKECQALDYYQTGVMPYMAITDMDNNDAIITYNINFGRWLYDNKLAFDPTKFNNPQLKITTIIRLAGELQARQGWKCARTCSTRKKSPRQDSFSPKSIISLPAA